MNVMRATPTPTTGGAYHDSTGQLTYRVDYYNHTGHLVNVVHRNGANEQLDTSPFRSQDGRLTIVVRHEVGLNATINGRHHHLDADEERVAFTEWMKKKDTKLLEYTYTVSLDELRGSDGVYVDAIDTLFSIKREVPAHPRSKTACAQRAELNDWLKGGLHYTISIIDNEAHHSTATDRYVRYANVAGEAIPIVVGQSTELPNGVYVSRTSMDKIKTNYYADMAACPIPLYLTREEAITHGDPTKAQERILAEIQHRHKLDRTIADIELANTKSEAESRKGTLAEELAAEAARLKAVEQLADKDNRRLDDHLDQLTKIVKLVDTTADVAAKQAAARTNALYKGSSDGAKAANALLSMISSREPTKPGKK